MKQGAPIRDVNMDTGISVAMTDLAAVSIISINRAPDAVSYTHLTLPTN